MAKILIVDVDLYESLLEEMALEPPHDVRRHCEEDDALEDLESGWADLLILDPAHPNAADCFRAAKQGKAHPPIPVLCVGDWDPGPYVDLLPPGAEVDRRLQQPIHAGELREAVNALLA